MKPLKSGVHTRMVRFIKNTQIVIYPDLCTVPIGKLNNNNNNNNNKT